MKFYADLHLHSHFSRATSKNLNLEYLWLWAQIKGIQVIGTGDFTHPGWIKELTEKLEPAEEGLFKLKKEYTKEVERQLPGPCKRQVRFILSAEIANIYKRHDRVRKVHNVVFAPDLKTAGAIRLKLDAIGNLNADGRPILGLDSRDLLEIVLGSNPLSFLVPAHIWTPWFSMLGSKGGFDSVEACYGDLTKHIFALETGLSSDPPMNWRLSQLDNYVLISNGDAHSPQKIGRESTIFDTGLSYPAMHKALSDPGRDKGLLGTVEFFPEEGKYHYDGHRACQTRLDPKETKANDGLCPACGKPVTVGVMARVEELADQSQGRKSPWARPFHSLIPLPEVIADAEGVGPNSKKVTMLFFNMLHKLGPEIFILSDAPIEMIAKASNSLIAEGVRRMRAGEVNIAAGYDGEFGKISLFTPAERKAGATQKDQFTLF